MKSFLRQLQTSASEFAPHLMAAILLLVLGWIVATLFKMLARRLTAGLDRLLPGKAWQRELRHVQMGRPLPDIIGSFVFWIVILIFTGLATETLGLVFVTTWVGNFTTYLPRVLLAVLIGVASIVTGALARDAVEAAVHRAGLLYGRALGRLAQSVILFVGMLAAIDQIGIETSFFTSLMMILVATVLGGAAIAFGLGARTAVSNILASHHLQKNYQVGQNIRLGSFEGRIVEINTTAVLLQGAEGQILIPAQKFSEEASVLLGPGSRK